MKKILIVMAIMLTAVSMNAQSFVRGSIRKGTGHNQVDVLFRSNYNSGVGEYLNYIQFSLTIPVSAYTPGVIATLTPVGNFTGLTFAQAAQYTQGSTNERVFTWVCLNPGVVTAMSWSNGVEFVGATVTFTGGPGNAQVNMADYSNAAGGSNSNTYFSVVSSQQADVTDYADFFYANPGQSIENLYGNADQFVRTVPLVSLPVDMLSFSGYRSGAKNILNWTTSSEQNNKGFEVQRSTDGSNYVSLGFVNSLAPGGNSATELNYSYTDNNFSGSRQYYRLRQVNLDNSSKYSNIVLIKGDRGLQMTIDGLYPNPATTRINVLLEATNREKVTLVLSDMSGKIVSQTVVEVQTGNNTIPVEISTLANGTYTVKLVCSSGCENVVSKFVKQ